VSSKKPKRKILLTPVAKEDLHFWELNNSKMIIKINSLLEAILENPENGIGKPEKLKYELSGSWSRRISHKDRIVYQVEADAIIVLQLRDHY